MPGLSTPLEISSFVARNRIIVPPMATSFAQEDGRATDAHVDHYRERAAGGAGVVIVEHSYVTLAGRIDARQLSSASDDVIEGLARLAVAIHQGGALAILQLNHAGARARRSDGANEPAGPSAVALPGEMAAPRAMTLEEIATLPGLFAAAARRALSAGFDGVEVHGAHGFLLNQFTSALTNHRTDGYGGSVEKRLKLPLEVLGAVRTALDAAKNPTPLLSYRLGADDGVAGGLTPVAVAEFAPRLVEAGVDFLNVSGGLIGSRPAGASGQGYFVPAASVIKQAVGIPVAGVGGVTDATEADRFVREGLVDAVCVGRAHLKNPRWATEALEELAGR